MTTNTLTKQDWKTFLISALGGSLEFYDFIVYVFFAQIIAKLFFNASTVAGGLLLSFTVFATGYLARVLGGLLFSHFGDKNGRKKSFSLTIFLMAAPTFLIGVLPTYSQIGILATILLVLCRIAQGLAVGGEIPCSIVFIYEHAPVTKRGFGCGVLFCGIILGIFLGSSVGAIVTKLMPQDVLYAWGWRIPFIIGGVLGLVGVYLRRHLYETPLFAKIQKEKVKFPIAEILKDYKLNVLKSTTVIWVVAVAVTLYLLYLPVYLNVYYHFPSENILIINSVAVFIYAFFAVFWGYLVDKIGAKKILNFGLIIFILASFPIFSLFEDNNYMSIYLCYSIVIIANSAVTAAAIFLLADSFPTKSRYSGTSLSYNLAFGVFGGFTPLIASELIRITGANNSPAYYMIAVSALGVIAINFLPEKSLSPRENTVPS